MHRVSLFAYAKRAKDNKIESNFGHYTRQQIKADAGFLAHEVTHG
jgi:hypothetical protein